MRYLLWLGCMIGITQWTFAAPIYQYVDGKGVVSYTDQLERAAPYKPQLIPLGDTLSDVKLHILKREGVHYLFAYNPYSAAVRIGLRFTRLHNTEIEGDLGLRFTLPPRREIALLKLISKKVGDWDYDYRYSLLGAPFLVNTPDEIPNITTLPFWGRYQISQGFNGAFSHFGLKNRYALDIAMPINSPVVAVRSGVVTHIVQHHQGYSVDSQYRDRTNYIRIRHSDGTYSLFAHLAYGSSSLKVGDRVREGQLIARSGQNGFSTGPHLHFALQRKRGERYFSMPFLFSGKSPERFAWLGDYLKGS